MVGANEFLWVYPHQDFTCFIFFKGHPLYINLHFPVQTEVYPRWWSIRHSHVESKCIAPKSFSSFSSKSIWNNSHFKTKTSPKTGDGSKCLVSRPKCMPIFVLFRKLGFKKIRRSCSPCEQQIPISSNLPSFQLSTNIQHRCPTISLSRKFFFSEINGFFVTPTTPTPPPQKKKKRKIHIHPCRLLASQWKKIWVSRVDSMLRYFNGSGGGNFGLILMLWRSQVRIVGFSHFRGNPFWNHFRTVHLGFTPNPECNRHYQDYYLFTRES